MQKRGWFGRILHPFSSSKVLPTYNDPKLRGLILDLQVTPQPVKLSEIRQLEIKATLTNQAKRAITLEFPTDQRIEIYLLNSAQDALTKWSENHAFNEKPGIAWRKPVNELYPSDRIIQLAIQKGIRFTTASDAYSHAQLGENFERLADKMSILGARKMCVYAKHKRIEHDV